MAHLKITPHNLCRRINLQTNSHTKSLKLFAPSRTRCTMEISKLAIFLDQLSNCQLLKGFF